MCGGRDTHGGTVVLSVGLGAVPAQEQAAQIRHRITENREQFRVRAQGPGKGLRAWRGSSSARLDLPGDFLRRWGLDGMHRIGGSNLVYLLLQSKKPTFHQCDL